MEECRRCPITHLQEDLERQGCHRCPITHHREGMEHQISYLRDQAQMLKQQMDQIDARIKELEKAAQ
jgi:hypothetical protein